ncbi:hypothetical protein CCMA1212_010571 [Trichoderma ghanense]|uniref:Uncharacterized protein n=1 Tax=Trichoderma ghanense TaxID=65468 RepID=A0ABY2GQ08_9HYPO
MTPKLKLSEHARKTLLSWMRKLALPGRRRTRTSMQMMDAPKTQASPLTVSSLSTARLDSLVEASRTNAAHHGQNPPAGVIVDECRRQQHGDSTLFHSRSANKIRLGYCGSVIKGAMGYVPSVWGMESNGADGCWRIGRRLRYPKLESQSTLFSVGVRLTYWW